MQTETNIAELINLIITFDIMLVLRSSVTFLSSHFLVVSLCSGQILSCDSISIVNEVSGQIPDEQNKLQLSTIKNNSDLKVITQSNFELVESLTVNFKKF